MYDFLKKSRLVAVVMALTLGLSACSDSDSEALTSLIDDSSNPYQMLFVSDTKAYILRYGSSDIWVVDPSVLASDEEGFKVGEISLSAYDDDRVPQMVAGLIYDNKLFVVMQAMSEDFVPGDAYMAVVDVLTDEEINVDANPLKGLALKVKNPVDIDLQGNSIFVTGIGRYGSAPREPEYTGGIEKINLADYSSTILVDDGDDTTHPYGQISGLSIISDTKAYFTGYSAWQSVSLYEFNPSTGVVVDTAIEGYDAIDIQSMEVSPEDDLWLGIGSFSAPEVHIISSTDNTLIDTISLEKNPTQIKFNATTASIVGVASDYGSSDISLAEVVSPYSVDLGYAAQDLSDIVAAIDDNSFYRLGRSSQHNVTQYSLANPQVVEWQFSTNP